MKHFSTQFEVLTFTLSDQTTNLLKRLSLSPEPLLPQIFVSDMSQMNHLFAVVVGLIENAQRWASDLKTWGSNRSEPKGHMLFWILVLHYITLIGFHLLENLLLDRKWQISVHWPAFFSLSHTHPHVYIHTHTHLCFRFFSTDHRVTVNEWLVFHILGFRGLTELMASLACSSVLDWQLQFPQWSRVDGWWWKWWVDGVLVTFCILRHAILHYSINVSLILLHSDKLRVMMMPDHYWKA